MISRVPIGCVHGRFQPPHLDHYQYILAALQHVEHLIIGIAQPDAPSLDACKEDPHRGQIRDNPLTRDQREEAIRRMLIASSIPRASFSFRPFPIDRPEDLPNFVPTNVVCFTTIMDDWNLEKISRLERLGYTVEALWDRRGQAQVRGTEVRELIRVRDVRWRDFVHPAVAHYLEEEGLTKHIEKG